MRRSTIRKVEDLLRDYTKIDDYIEEREQQLRYPTGQTDENIGGGRAQFKYNETVLDTLITIDEDRRINALKWQREIIDDCLDGVDKNTEKIIEELYFKKHPQYTLLGLVNNHVVNVSQRHAYELRNGFVSEVAKKLGLYDL